MTDRDLLVLLVATGVATGLSGGLVLLYVWVVARRIRRHLHALQTGIIYLTPLTRGDEASAVAAAQAVIAERRKGAA